MKLKLAIPVLAFALCTGCDTKTANDSNLAAGINHSLAQAHSCLASLSDFPTRPQNANPTYDALTAQGLMTRAAAPAVQPTSSSLYVYDLTGKGKADPYIAPDANPAASPRVLCTGTRVVDQILNFTEPSDLEGVKQTHVVYTMRWTGVPSWTRDPALMKAINLEQNNPAALTRKREAVLALTSKGWRVSGDM